MKKKSNFDILMIMFGFTFFSGSMLIGQTLSNGLNLLDFILCIFIGGIILGIFGGTLGFISSKTNDDMKSLSIKSFGIKGSYLPSILVGVTQVGWYGVGVSMFAVPVANILAPDNIFILYLLIVIFGVFMTISTCIGIKSIAKVSYIAVFTILIFGILSIIYALNSKSIDILNSFGLKENISFIVGLEMVIGSYISGSITTPNFAKYGKNPFFIGIICFMAFLLGNGLMIVFGAASNILVGGNDIFDIFTYFGFNLLGIIVLGLNIWSSCDNGLYSAGLEFENIFKIEHKKIILILGLLSTLCSYYLYSNFISFLSIMNYTLPPVGVVLITNYLFKGNYSKNKINLFNCLAVAAGIISSFFIKYGIALVNGIIITFVISSLGYFIKQNKLFVNCNYNN